VRLDQLGLNGSALAEAIRLRAQYAQNADARAQKIESIRSGWFPIPGETDLSMSDYWQLVLKVDPKGRDEGRTERMDRLHQKPEGSAAHIQPDPRARSASSVPIQSFVLNKTMYR
jgi:hypothetical protein